jgi:hypothetical protein
MTKNLIQFNLTILYSRWAMTALETAEDRSTDATNKQTLNTNEQKYFIE